MKFKFKHKPRIVIMAGENWVSYQVITYLAERGENLVAILQEKTVVTEKMVSCFTPDLIITCYWPRLLKPEIFNIPKYGCINFHPSLLPKNRGWYPSVWPFIDGSPAGVTLHKIDQGADTGPIIAQKELKIDETDTAGTLYRRSQEEIVELFKETWPKLYKGIILQKQDEKQATYHTKKEANDLDIINLDQTYTGKEIIERLKAKSFINKSYAYYIKNGKRYNIQISIKENGG